MQSFIDQSPIPTQEGLQRVFRTQTMAERIASTLMGIQQDSKCILYPNEITWMYDHGFISVTFLGMELDLLLHDILVFNCVDLAFENTAISVFISYLVHLLRVFVRNWFGKTNVSIKSGLDYRFVG